MTVPLNVKIYRLQNSNIALRFLSRNSQFIVFSFYVITVSLLMLCNFNLEKFIFSHDRKYFLRVNHF